MRKVQVVSKFTLHRRFRPIVAGMLVAAFLPVQPAFSSETTDRLFCPLTDDLPDRPQPLRNQPPGTVTVEADDVDITKDGLSLLSGDVLIQRDAEFMSGESIEFDQGSGEIRSLLPIRFGDEQIDVNADRAEYDTALGTGIFEGVDFVIPSRPARGEADSLERISKSESELAGVMYTTCPFGEDDWTLRASSMDIDQESGRGTGRNVRLAFMGVPFFYTPWIQFPIDDRRMTGLLFPEYGSSDLNGNWLTLPVYLNISENHDATIAPWFSSERGTRLDSEFRYLWTWGNGSLTSEYLDEDRETGETRYQGRYRHTSAFAENWNALVDYRVISDPEYIQDFSESSFATENSFIPSSFRLTSAGIDHGFEFLVRQYEKVDPTLPAGTGPYDHWPSVKFTYAPLPLLGFLNAGLATEIINFRKAGAVQGWRQHVEPYLSIDFGNPGFRLTPRIAAAYTRFDLEQADGTALEIDRSVPVSSLDARWVFERATESGGLQTLEPRIFYLSVPYREQSTIPLFDTRQPTPSLDNLYRYNRFPGLDRYGDTRQATLGLESKLYQPGRNWAVLRLRAAQALYFEDRLVTLDSSSTADARSTSDLYTELHYAPLKHSSIKLSASWDDPEQRINIGSIRYQFRPGATTVLNVTYSFRRDLATSSTSVDDSLKQGSVSFAAPIGSRWKVFGKSVYSIMNHRSLDNLAGFEYESCCWSFRVVNRRYIFNRNGDFNQALWLQLTLKGMGSVGRRADEMLAEDIRGYGDEVYEYAEY